MLTSDLSSRLAARTLLTTPRASDTLTRPTPAPVAFPVPSKSGYRPEIDGLRAFAVLPVILFHLGVPGFHGGSLGVDVFFVISGFLILSIVKREADAGEFSFKTFWARRVRRIMPAMLAMTTASLAFAFLFLYRPDQPAVAKQATASLLSVANLYFWAFVGDYWGMAAGQSPFLHMWSLAVEEQFYLFVPPAIWLIYKIAPKRLLACVLAVMVASLGLFLWQVHKRPEAAFYLLPTRAWEMAAGAALAVSGVRHLGRSGPLVGLLGLAMVVTSYFAVSSFGAGVMVPVFGTVLVIVGARSGPAFAVLANPVAVYVGKLSYSLYLWHWPVIVFPGFMSLHVSVYTSLAVTAALATASYYLVEMPTRHDKRVVPIALGVMTLATLAAACMAAFPRAYDTRAFETPRAFVQYYDSNPTAPASDATFANLDVLPKQLGPKAFVEGGLMTGTGTPQVVMLGDSHATFWAPVVRQTTDRLNVPASYWMMSGVSPFFSVPAAKRPVPWYISQQDTLAYDQARIRKLAQWKPKVVIVATRWSVKYLGEMTQFIDYVSQNADRVLLIEQPPELPVGNRNVMDYLCYQGIAPRDGEKQFYDVANADTVAKGRELMRKIVATHPNCTIVPTHGLYEHADQTCVLDGRHVVYMDDDHLTFYGASMAGERIDQAVAAALAE